MKTSRIAALAILASLAGFNVYADSGDNYQPLSNQKFVSTLTRVQVQAEATKAASTAFRRGYNNDSGEYLISAPADASAVGLKREAVRAEAIKARSVNMQQYSAG